MTGDPTYTKRIFTAVAILILLTDVSVSRAASLVATPGISLGGIWDSNIFNVPDNEESDFIFRATPGLALSLAAYKTTLILSANVDLDRYAKHPELNSKTNTSTVIINLNVSEALPLMLTPRLTITPFARYVETKDSIRMSKETQNPIPGLPPSDKFISSGRTGIREYGGSLKMDYLVSPHITFGLGGGAQKREYTENPTGLIDSETLNWATSLSYKITPNISSGLGFGATYDYFKDRPTVTSYNGGLIINGGFPMPVAENLVFNGRMGLSYNVESKKYDPAVGLSLTYSQLNWNATLNGSYALAGGGSFGKMTHRWDAGLGAAGALSERWGWNLYGGYQRSRSIDQPETEDVASTGGAAGIGYSMNRYVSIRLSGNVSHQLSYGLQGNDLKKESVFLGINIGNSYLIF